MEHSAQDRKILKFPHCEILGNDLYAKVGLTETTSKIQKYELAENPLIHLYDLPGAGMENFPISSYPKTVKMDDYDVFILLARGRFQENDKIILTEIEKRRKPCYFARTHTDVDLQEFEFFWNETDEAARKLTAKGRS